MEQYTRRGTLALGTGGVLAATMRPSLVGAAIPRIDIPPPHLPIERGASLRVVRPARFVGNCSRSPSGSSISGCRLRGELR